MNYEFSHLKLTNKKTLKIFEMIFFYLKVFFYVKIHFCNVAKLKKTRFQAIKIW